MKLRDYLFDKKYALLALILVCLFSLLFLSLMSVGRDGIWMIEGLILTAACLALLVDYGKRQSYYKDLLEALENLDRKTLLTEVIEEPDFLDARVLVFVLREVQKYMNEEISEYDTAARDYREYVETWVHEIKNPIASAKLIIENDKNITTLNIEEEIDKIEGFVEQALYYARSSHVEQDYILKKISLKEIVMPEIVRCAKQMIRAGLKPQLKDLDYVVSADPKWSGFIVGQILSNAIKYCGQSHQIFLYGEVYANHVSLIVRDQGIGISPRDLKRVFQKGFTGENGRRQSKSTGIGLYLCKKLCDKMGMGIQIRSALGEGTAVELIFPKGSLTADE